MKWSLLDKSKVNTMEEAAEDEFVTDPGHIILFPTLTLPGLEPSPPPLFPSLNLAHPSGSLLDDSRIH